MTDYEKWALFLQGMIACAAFISVWLVLRQLRAMSMQIKASEHASEAQSIIEIVNFLQATDARAARETVRAKLSKTHYESWDESQKRDASLVCANYDVVAALLNSGLIQNKQVIVSNWAPSIKHCHQILSPFIEAKRKDLGGDLSYWSNFDWLKAECERHRG